ncbi:methionyl-tRNA formyltransferase [Halalkalibacillus halophilus]|uniref:methionyl-tRNA formyltransferase n=1 Tax=Halalkalibacillus halophilus TaxID=392827 RepID=UPI0003FB32F5|nr:methionyl-tRNA formyltransferase [Halalkalibacillus halophilus]
MSKRIVFMGTPDFSVPILKNLIDSDFHVVAVVTQPDRPKGRKRKLTPSPVKSCALDYDLPVLQPEKIREDYEAILSYEPDLIITAAYGQILPEAILTHPPYGCINVHASLLPEYRGGAPIHYAIIDGKDKTGVSIMYMVKALDAGDVIEQVTVPIEEKDHVGSVHDKLSQAGSDLLLKVLPKLFSKEISPVQQNESFVTYAKNITREQEMVNWNDSQQHIYNHVRGLHPWPVAYTTYQDQTLKLWWVEKTSATTSEKGGTIVSIEEDGILVATGDQKLIKLIEIQPSGKKRMLAKDFLRGSKEYFQIGEQLG